MIRKFSWGDAAAYPKAVDMDPSIPLVPRLASTSTFSGNLKSWAYLTAELLAR